MTVGIMDVAAVCAVATCGGVDNVEEAPPPAFLTISDIYEEFLTPDYAPYKDGVTARFERKLNDKDDEIKELKKEVKELERSRRDSNNITSDDTSPNSSRDMEVDETDKDAVISDKNSEGSVEDGEAVGRTFEATYYSAFCPTGCTGKTATGHDVSNSIHIDGKRVVAVDPNVIPLESTVKVTTPNETFEAKAMDTGGDIKGNRIDILVGSTEEAYSIGRHDVTVEVLD